MASRTGGHLRLFPTELTQGLQHHRLGFGGKGGETDMLFFGWAWKSRRDPSCLRHWPGAWGFGGRRRKSGCCLWCGLGWSWEGCFPLLVSVWGGVSGGVSFLSTFPLFFNPVRSLGQDTAQYTHTQRLGLQKERDSAVGGMGWDARGCGISFRTGLVWSGLVWFFFFIWNGNTHLIHITSPHDGTSTLHCTAPTPLDGGRTGGQGYRLASSGRPAASYLLQPYS